jgi:hypothetical protein
MPIYRTAAPITKVHTKQLQSKKQHNKCLDSHYHKARINYDLM